MRTSGAATRTGGAAPGRPRGGVRLRSSRPAADERSVGCRGGGV